MYCLQWMLNNCTSILHFTFVHFHVTLRGNQRPSVGNIICRHVSMANMLVNNSVNLTQYNVLAPHAATTAKSRSV